MCVNYVPIKVQGSQCNGHRLEPVTIESQIQRPNYYTSRPDSSCLCAQQQSAKHRTSVCLSSVCPAAASTVLCMQVSK